MDATGFNKDFLNGLLGKISKENKKIFFLGNSNSNLLHYKEHRPANDFFDSLSSSSLPPYILPLT